MKHSSIRRAILWLCVALLALLLLACDDNWDGMDRSGWGWDGSRGDEPVPPPPNPTAVQKQLDRRGRP